MASMYSQYPVVLNGVTYAPFKTWDITYNDKVETHQTEGGTEEDTISRKGRRSISVSTTCLDSVARNLTALQELAYFTCKFYELKLNGYATIDMRIAPNSFKARLKEKSAKHDGINGIWTISFTLEEF